MHAAMTDEREKRGINGRPAGRKGEGEMLSLKYNLKHKSDVTTVRFLRLSDRIVDGIIYRK